jgi:hypothetical protein
MIARVRGGLLSHGGGAIEAPRVDLHLQVLDGQVRITLGPGDARDLGHPRQRALVGRVGRQQGMPAVAVDLAVLHAGDVAHEEADGLEDGGRDVQGLRWQSRRPHQQRHQLVEYLGQGPDEGHLGGPGQLEEGGFQLGLHARLADARRHLAQLQSPAKRQKSAIGDGRTCHNSFGRQLTGIGGQAMGLGDGISECR